MNIAIIGAGISGCNIYNRLKKQNHNITIFDKARGVGGRLSTKYVDDKFIDHGTSSFKVNNSLFKEFCDELISNKILIKKDDEYFPLNGINKLCSYLINKNDLIKNQRITKAEFIDNKWSLISEDGNKYDSFDKLIITIPTPQILQMHINLSENTKNLLNSVSYDSVATLICYSNNIINLEHPKLFESALFSKIINNSKKYNYKKFSSYVFHTNSEFANSINELSKEKIGKKIYKKIEDLIGVNLDEECYTVPHLWKYGKVKSYLSQDFIYENSLGICGDYFNGNSLESAYISSTKLSANI